MSLPPPLPPHPDPNTSYRPLQSTTNARPPVPPLPPDYRPDSRTHPLFAPMPERIMPSLPADITRTLDDAAVTPSAMSYHGQHPQQQQLYPSPHVPFAQSPQVGYGSPYGTPDPYRGSTGTPQPPPSTGPFPGGIGYPGGFARSESTYSYHPNRSRTPAASYAPPQGAPGLGLGPGPGGFVAPLQSPPPVGYAQPGPAYYPPPSQPVNSSAYPTTSLPAAMENLNLNRDITKTSSTPKPPDLTAPIPTVETLLDAQRHLPHSPTQQTHLAWIRDVIFVIEKFNPPSETGIITITDPKQRGLVNSAATALLTICSIPGVQPSAEALYLRGVLCTTGCASDVIPRSPREAFRDFEAASRGGWAKAWFKIGRDYETVGDVARARDCFERGMRANIESCFYRMGMARLLGQLGLPTSHEEALPLLHKAAALSTVETPQPAYVYGLILLGEFAQVAVPESLFFALNLIPSGGSPLTEARKYIERAAFLGFAPAQYKLGHAYEYAIAPFEADPLLSVQWYSLASQQGEAEADMALSKWFLCGAEGAFEKDESLAYVFAEKAASNGLPSAEFAMGYYAEVGIGTAKNVEAAKSWYEKAISHGNTDAPDRLAALSQPSPQALSRVEHEQITDDRLVRRRSQAKANAEAAGRVAGPNGRADVLNKVKAQAVNMPAIGEEEPDPAPRRPSYVTPHQQPPLRQSPGPIPEGPVSGGPSHVHHVPVAHPPVPHHAQSLGVQGQGQGQGPPGVNQHLRQFSDMKRYTLTDGPAGYAGAPPNTGPGQRPYPPLSSGSGIQPSRAPGRPPGRRHEGSIPSKLNGPGGAGAPPPAGVFNPSPNQAPAPEEPSQPPQPLHRNTNTTFAELGFTAAKAEEKECIIM